MAALWSGCAVKIIVIKRAAYMCQMYAYLVRAAGKKCKFKQRFAVVCINCALTGTGIFAAFADAAFDNAAFLAGNGRFNASA